MVAFFFPSLHGEVSTPHFHCNIALTNQQLDNVIAFSFFLASFVALLIDIILGALFSQVPHYLVFYAMHAAMIVGLIMLSSLKLYIACNSVGERKKLMEKTVLDVSNLFYCYDS